MTGIDLAAPNGRIVASWDALSDIVTERLFQQRMFTDEHDDRLGVDAWLDLVTEQIDACARGLPAELAALTSRRPAMVRNRLVKIAALAIAGIMALDRAEAANARR